MSPRPSSPVAVSLHAGLLIAVLGVVAWGTGLPFVFPSLGPTAFVLAYESTDASQSAWTVIGGHAWGVGSGLLSYHLLASGTSLLDLAAAGSVAGAQLAASAAVATGLTSALMIGTRSVHPPACATTLIVGLGLLPTLAEGGIILLAVTLLWGLSKGWTVYRTSGPDAPPSRRDRDGE